MPAKVILDVTQGAMAGRKITFDEHDSLIFGRMQDCKICMPSDDATVSRHHFIMEVIPPHANIRDLGSKNGTWVNGVKYGGREEDETPEQGAKRAYPQVELKDGDVIRIGKTYMQVSTEQPVICIACGEEIPESDLAEAFQDDCSYLCASCRAHQTEPFPGPPSQLVIRCLNCGKDVTDEAGPYVTGGYLCLNCRELAQEQVVDPMEVLQAMFKEARLEKEPDLNIPDYEVIKQLGRGGMGAVYLVQHKATGQKSALKIMLPKAELIIRNKIKFQREIEIMRKLGQHKYIVDFYNAGEVNNIYYFLMEFCEGGSADGLAGDSGGKLDLETAGRIMLQSLEGLAYAHEQGYVHRDLKPPNILLSSKAPDGIAKIADMGLAKDFTQAGYSGITGKEYAGTLPFMPREQISDFKSFKPVSDVWSMGATIYNLLTDRFPREFTKDVDPVMCILKNPVIPIERLVPTIPRRMAEVINTSLEDNIANRYQSALEFKEALENAL